MLYVTGQHCCYCTATTKHLAAIAGVTIPSRQNDTATAQARVRIAELESQIEIEQMPADQPESSDRVSELESAAAAANSRIAELESQIEAMIEQIGSSADEAVIVLEKDIVSLKKELQDAQRDIAATHAAANEAVSLLQESNKERDAFKSQVWLLSAHPMCTLWCTVRLSPDCRQGASHLQNTAVS